MLTRFNRFSNAVFAIILSLPIFVAAQDKSQDQQSKQQRKAEAKQQAAEHQPRAEAGATSTSRLALPFKRAWQYLTNDALTVAPSVDETRIYLPLAGGRVVCLDRETGALRWSSELGGMVTAPVAVGESSVYISTRKLADDGSEAGGSVRAVDKATGLTVWMKDYTRPFASTLELTAKRIYAGSADGSFYALDINNGDPLWKIDTQDIVRGRALVTDRAIYFGSDDGGLRAVDPEHGQIIWKYQTAGKVVGQPAIDERVIFFGAGDGFLYAADFQTGKLKWRARTGAAIEGSPVLVGDRILIASFDNFVYALARSTGDKLWKRRLENRINSTLIMEGDASLVAPLRGDYVAVFLNADGRRVNLYRLEKDNEIVADPIFSNGTLVLLTSNGLVVTKATKAVDNPTNAVKK